MVRLSILLVLVLIGGCATTQRASVDFNPDFDFSMARSYAIVMPGNISTVPSTLVSRRVMRAIRTEMDEKGFLEVLPSEADVHISFITTSRDRTDVAIYQNYNNYFAYRSCWRCAVYYVNVPVTEVERIQYVEGQIIVDVIDPKGNELVWCGMTTRRYDRNEVTSMNPDKLTRIVNDSVERILASYPPL